MALIPLENVHWVLASKWESHSESCLRNSLSPLEITSSTSWAWNITVLSYVVSLLGKRVSKNATHGISGCCAPSLWCDANECFTQGYSKQYVNYGWLPSSTYRVSNPSPVYTCYKAKVDSTYVITSNSYKNSIYAAQGKFTNTEPFPSIRYSAYIYGVECSNVEVHHCSNCFNGFHCPLGKRCLSLSPSQNACFTTCSSNADLSCPRGYKCTAISDFYYCKPDTSQDINRWCSSTDFSSSSDILTCKVNTGQLQQHVSMNLKSTTSLNVTISSDNLFVVGKQSYTPIEQKCKQDSDCFDENLCTKDTCNVSTGLCANELMSDFCDSISQSIRENLSPFVYHTFTIYQTIKLHDYFSSFMLKKGKMSTVSYVDDGPFQRVQLRFVFNFFGNLVTEVFISPNGAIFMPPMQSPTEYQQFSNHMYSTSSNAIAVWDADWNPGQTFDAKVVFFNQVAGDQSMLFGIDATAFHVLFYNLTRYDTTNESHTFASSLYSDGSIRLSYFNTGGSILYTEFSGLWGSFISEKISSYSRYHMENVSQSVILSGGDVVYCFLKIIACIDNTCVRSGSQLKVNWNASSATRCDALAGRESPVSPLELSCHWAGGLAITEASVDPNDSDILQCDVPVLPFQDGFLTFVDIVISIRPELTNPSIGGNYVQESSDNFSGKRSVIGISSESTLGASLELSRTNLMVRYYSSNDSTTIPPGGCGCNVKQPGSSCGAANICGARNLSNVLDCAGTAFGSAFIDSCGSCSMGYTNVEPSFACSASQIPISPTGDSSVGFLNLISQTIVILLIICCMTFLTSTISYTVRRLLFTRQLQEQRLESELAMTMLEGNRWNEAASRGLSEFERDALGQVTFTAEFYAAYLKTLHHTQQDDIENSSSSPSLAVIDFTNKDEREDGKGGLCECSICLMDIQEGNLCRVLPEPCGHIFHLACIDEWFQQSQVCPLCKRSMRAILTGSDDALSIRTSPLTSPNSVDRRINTVALNEQASPHSAALDEVSFRYLPPPRPITNSIHRSSTGNLYGRIRTIPGNRNSEMLRFQFTPAALDEEQAMASEQLQLPPQDAIGDESDQVEGSGSQCS